MKFLLTSILFLTTILSFSQGPVNFSQLVNNWTQAKPTASGALIEGGDPRGGSYRLSVNFDQTVLYRTAFDCGSGHKSAGTWELNKSDSTVTFNYAEETTYTNPPSSKVVNKTETFKILTLTSNELVLTRPQASIYITKYFVRE